MTRHLLQRPHAAAAFVFALLLAACGGGGSGGAADPLDSVPVYGPADAASPPGASDVTPEQLRALIASGAELRWLRAADTAAAVAEESASAAADAALLAASTNPDIVALRATPIAPPRPGVVALPGGDRAVRVDGPDGPGRVIVNGARVRDRGLASAARALASRANAVALYRQLRETLPAAALGDLPASDTLDARSDAEVQTLVDLAAQRVLATLPNDSATPPQALANRVRPLGLQQRLAAGEASGCGHASRLSVFSDFDFALKNSITSIKDQGNRGTCAAFAMSGAFETEIKRAYNRSADLSEQQLFARGRGVWFQSIGDFGDGMNVDSTLDKLKGTLYTLRTEKAWGYNRSPDRIETDLGIAGGIYQNSCDGYTQACSDTNHQMRISCTTVLGNKVCAETNPADGLGAGVEGYLLQSAANLQRPTAALTVEMVRVAVVSGHSAVLSVDVYECLANARRWWKNLDDEWEEHPQSAYVNNERCDLYSDTVPIGSHAMLAVGWISDADLKARYGADAPKAEGGYFIVKNSWGCNYGDGGFAYISARYLEQVLTGASSIGAVGGDYPKLSLGYDTTQPFSLSAFNNYNIVQPVTATLTATGNALVKKVIFYRKGALVATKLATVTGATTFQTSLAIDAGDNGDRTFYAYGYDAQNNVVASNTVLLRVRIPGAPTVSASAAPNDLLEGNPITLSATAASSDGSGITKVEFWEGLTKLGEDTTAPYSLTVPTGRDDAGDHAYTARAVNGNGYKTTSAPVVVRVRSTAKPTIGSFVATPALMPTAGPVKFTWNVSGADTLVLNPGGIVLTGSSKTITVAASTLYTLVATNANGSVSANQSVRVIPPPSIGSFTATPSTTPTGGGTVTLAWNAANATTLAIDQGVGSVVGLTSRSVAVTSSKTFTLTAGNASGTATRQVTVTVPATPPAPPAISAFAATPASLPHPGGPSTLSWTVTGATALAIDHGVGSVTGLASKPVNVAGTTTYTLSATNAGGTSTAQVTVTVAPPPPAPPVITSFGANPASLPAGGGSSTLNWSVSGATTLSIDQGIGEVTGLISRSVGVAATTAYTLTATNAGGSTTAQVTVSVADPTADRWVDPAAGNDANAGSEVQPWKTLGKGLATTASGATLWLKNGSYTRAAEGMGVNDSLTVPGGLTLRGTSLGGATLRFGLRAIAGSVVIADIAFDEADTLDSAVYATDGSVTLRRIRIANAGWCDIGAIRGAGTAVITLDDGGTPAHEYAGAGIRGFVRLVGDARLTISGGRISGVGNDLCAGGSAVLSTGNTAVLTLNGVTVRNSAFPDATSGTVQPVLGAFGSSRIVLTDTLIDGAVTGTGGGSAGVRTGDQGSATLLRTTVRNMAGSGPAVAPLGAGTLQITDSILTANGAGIDGGNVGSTITVSSSQITDNRSVGIQLLGGGSFTLSDSLVSGNWTSGAAGVAVPRASGVALWGGGAWQFTMRGTSVRDNGNVSAASPGIALEGDAGSVHDLGSGGGAAANRVSGNANTGVAVSVDGSVTVRASGTVWNAGVQGADGNGLYQLGSAPCGSSGPCSVSAGDGGNYKVLFGALKLVD